MNKKLYFFIPFISLLILCISALGACGRPVEDERLKVHTVFFHDNYQGIYAKITVEAGQSITLPANPSRTGFDFVGWMLSEKEDATVAYDHLQPLNDNITVYAKWQRNDAVSLVTLKFLNYRTMDEIYAIEKNSVFALPENPIYDEDETYAFVNWYTDKECTQVYDFDSAVSSDITLYAGWSKQKAYLTIDYNYIGSPAPVVKAVKLGEAISVDAPTRDQYEFVGWYTKPTGGEPFDFETPLDSNVTIYARWSRNAYNVSFNLNGGVLDDSLSLSYLVAKNTSIETEAETIEDALTYVGHDFAGWYMIKTNPNSEDPLPQEHLADLSSINDDLTVYAGWTLSEYEIKFDYNFENPPEQPAKQTIKYKKYIQNFSVLARDGYSFGGWFTEPGCLNQFTLADTPVVSNLTLYAKWIEDAVQYEDIKVNYYYDIGAGDVSHALVEVEYNGTVGNNSPQDPVIANYVFAGWYRDKAFTTKFSTSMNLIADTNVYGKMLKKYTFEAEAVNFHDKLGQGTSTNSFEEGLIMDHTFVRGGNVSNGYFVRELYYYGASLDFVIEAEEEETDAVLYIRASSESYQFFGAKSKEEGGPLYNFISDTDFKIVVNGEWEGAEPKTWLAYGGMYLPMANLVESGDLSTDKTPFEDIFIIEGLTLKKGTNLITLLVSNNKNHGGTFHSEAPIIDCIYLYSSVELTMFDYEYYLKDGVKRG
ncbi:MAG: InlB B-repeat-containing protein [Acholeplasmataceae bacterium]|nr:InlB B-repeat-containing protein [Acholeplasmataceae bacterium]